MTDEQRTTLDALTDRVQSNGGYMSVNESQNQPGPVYAMAEFDVDSQQIQVTILVDGSTL